MPKTIDKQDLPNDAPEGQASGAEQLGEEAIRARAYEISQRENAGSADENWERAIAELRAEQQSSGS